MSKLTTQPTVITTAAVNPFTRRTFMKTSALTVGAVTLLSKGTALAEEGVGSSQVKPTRYSKQFEYKLVLTDFPIGENSTGKAGDWKNETVEVIEMGSNIGSLTLTSKIVDGPDPGLKLADTEFSSGLIPEQKLRSTFSYQTAANLAYNAFILNFLHRNDSCLPSVGFLPSPKISMFLTRNVNSISWTEGEVVPVDPPDPSRSYNVAVVNDRSFGDGNGFLYLACGWSKEGNIWGGMLSIDPGKVDLSGKFPNKWFTAYLKFTADVSYSAKMNSQNWHWAFGLAKRQKTLVSINGGPFAESPWSKWEVISDF